ncbi:hypothetical protein CC77DRAFT_268576 [Alternaria alternata]|uniref:Uncharacterized protein n=1 Tax=Alternaria alternata TaxID=5599 RepID=A0A177DEW7_ALTAL|nr:hypothetical protein CC77DRAFT_268576 [Alternaria alternata]OAG17682.1 hypothetical protein CC77DRAFT_268576 [Alternaria alternata]
MRRSQRYSDTLSTTRSPSAAGAVTGTGCFTAFVIALAHEDILVSPSGKDLCKTLGFPSAYTVLTAQQLDVRYVQWTCSCK